MAQRHTFGARSGGIRITAVRPATLRVRVAGSSSSIPRPGRACSSYIVQSAETSIVIDVGTGALANLRTAREPADFDAVIISHMHADHFLDLVPLRYALKYGQRRRSTPLPLYLPPGGERTMRRLVSAFAPEIGGDFLDDVFDVIEYRPDSGIAIGDLQIRLALTHHWVPAFAMRVECESVVFAYSADTSPCDSVVEIARNATLFCCEATLGLREELYEPRGHCNAAEAGTMATQAGAHGLLLSHYGNEWSPDQLIEGARSCYDGPIFVADDGNEIRL